MIMWSAGRDQHMKVRHRECCSIAARPRVHFLYGSCSLNLSLTCEDEQRAHVQPRRGFGLGAGPGPGEGICCSPRTSLSTVTALHCVFLWLHCEETTRRTMGLAQLYQHRPRSRPRDKLPAPFTGPLALPRLNDEAASARDCRRACAQPTGCVDPDRVVVGIRHDDLVVDRQRDAVRKVEARSFAPPVCDDRLPVPPCPWTLVAVVCADKETRLRTRPSRHYRARALATCARGTRRTPRARPATPTTQARRPRPSPRTTMHSTA